MVIYSERAIENLCAGPCKVIPPCAVLEGALEKQIKTFESKLKYSKMAVNELKDKDTKARYQEAVDKKLLELKQ